MHLSKTLTLLLILLITQIGVAQNSVTINGKIVDSASNTPIEFATVLLLENETENPITGNTTNIKGEFSITTNKQNFFLQISFIGFKTKNIKDFKIINNEVNLGSISLNEDGEMLETLVIRAEKSTTEFKLDKRVFNVGKDLSSTGASALEILNNVPSVNVNIEGEISLRGSSGVQVLINGKPSVLASSEGNALGSITASMINKVEVITNPSAKYNAEGTSGIINIVLNKNDKKGLNGAVTLNVGSPTNNSIGLSLNKRTEKFNLFSQFGVGRRIFPSEGISISNDLTNNSTLKTTSDSDKQEDFYNIILGTDYHINKNNVLTLSGHLAYEKEKEDALLNYNSSTNNSITDEWRRTELTKATNPKWEYELQYKKEFENNKDQELLFSALGSSFAKDKTSNYTNEVITGNSVFTPQQTTTDFKEAEYTFKLDYVHPISEEFTLETGSQYVITDVTNDYEFNDFINNEWIIDANLSNIFEYNQKVLAGYITSAYENNNWGVKLGVRAENTDLFTLVKNTNQNNDQNYTEFFPSFHTSYNLSKKVSIQARYSKRIFRPRLWDLNPFFSFRDSFNQSVGNPNLNPEYSNSYELTSIFKFNKVNFNLGIYHLYTTDVMERITTFDNQIRIRRPENIGTKKTTGIELNGKTSPAKWINFNADFNYDFFTRKGSFENELFDFESDSWSGKLTTKIKFPSDIDFEFTNQYRSKIKSVQGSYADNFYTDLGIRKKIAKGKFILNLSVRDLFESRKRESTISQTNYNVFSESSRGRSVVFGISYGFGEGEAMEFGGNKRF